ncbi:MAG: sulfate reduction electron transfer complex DsrMKJOP subunit DsrM [Thermodesulfobacteriota bacterium]
MNILMPFLAVLALVVIPLLGAQIDGLKWLFGIVIPYAAIATFLGFFVAKVVDWAKSPAPFSIATSGGQAKSLPWVKQSTLDCPSSTAGVVGRMFLEIVCFRSLFRNTRTSIQAGPRLIYGPTKWLWLFGILFHYSFFIIFLRHFRLFVDPVPAPILALDAMDSFFQITLPGLYVTDLLILGAATFLFLRRVIIPQVRYISLANDYFPLFLIFAVCLSGILMRYIFKVNIAGVKEFLIGLADFSPSINPEIGAPFYVHLFLVSTLMAYFPFSKLMHLPGVFMSPTRNLTTNSREVRHLNPWNDPNIKPHAYEAYEDEFRDFMRDAGLPLEKDPQQPQA